MAHGVTGARSSYSNYGATVEHKPPFDVPVVQSHDAAAI